MNFISGVSALSPGQSYQEAKEGIRIQIDYDLYAPECMVAKLASVEGPLDIYCWYEGTLFLPKLGANFMKENIFKPLYESKQDAKLYLYSLRAWSFEKKVADMSSSTRLGKAINRINKAAVECIYSYSFFQYCAQIPKESGLYRFISEQLPEKKWLFSLSGDKGKKGITITKLFNDQSSLFDCIKNLDVVAAYSAMQYVEGYYLIQESVRKGLLNEQKKIQIAFALPNDEGNYYVDYETNIEKILQADFGKKISGVEIVISFVFFEYGDPPTSRPYMDKRNKAPRVGVSDIDSYFDYLLKPLCSEEQSRMLFTRDAIHNINGVY